MFNHSGIGPADVSLVARMTDLMRRRGPDDQGFWTDDSHAAFGFRRLSIIDPSAAGHQPMVSGDGRFAIVFNGELYNFRELRRQLEQHGVRFRSDSDTEVVLHAVATWGDDALRRFNGMFAFAWYDAVEHRLLLARDPIGIKPLYYFVDDAGLAFGSQYDQVITHPRCDRGSVDPAVMGLYLRLAYMPAPYGVFRGTHQLLPGHSLILTPGSPPKIRAYYELPTSPIRLRGRDAIDAVAEAVTEAVSRQMVSDVALGTFLSGGVDSPLVTALASNAARATLPAFTIASTDARFDESETARGYADQLPVAHHVRSFSEADALALLDDVAAAYSEPFADYSAFPSLMLSSLAREHVKVALSGDGGDELFWGYPRFAKVLKARPHFLRGRAVRAGVYAVSRYTGGERPARGILFPTVGDWYFDSHSALRGAQVQRIAPALRHLPPDFALYDRRDSGDPDELAQWLRWNEIVGHLQMVLLKVDRASMYHGLEARVPLLDLAVVEAAMRVDADACIQAGVGKQPLRTMLARHLRQDTIPTQKRGFSVPMGDWLRQELRPVVEALLLDRDPFPHGAFSRPALAKLYEEHRLRRRDHTRGLWALLSLQLWADRHLAVSEDAAVVPHTGRAAASRSSA